MGSDFVAIAAGQNHSVARKSDGSVVAWGLNDASQAAAPLTAVVEWYSYDVFGEPTIKGPSGLPRTASVVGNRFMFTGREYEKRNVLNPSLYYYRARYYSPTLGRFLQTDPISYTGGLNLYTYCNNNPIYWTDPYGLDKFRPWWVGPVGVIGDVAGGIYDAFHRTDGIRGPVGITASATGGMLVGYACLASGPPGWVLGTGLVFVEVGGILTVSDLDVWGTAETAIKPIEQPLRDRSKFIENFGKEGLDAINETEKGCP